jgi:thiol:disulfide interchange protein DsbD
VGRAVCAIAASILPWVPVVADAQTKLLAPERAFAFSVQALDAKTVEARFAIADGYYLYRDKLGFSVEPGVLVEAPALPPGKIKDDEFFGRVATYRGRLAVKLSLDKPAPGQKITVRAQSQGCADAGVCYPPQVQNITVALPDAGARPGPPVEATPARKSWFN